MEDDTLARLSALDRGTSQRLLDGLADAGFLSRTVARAYVRPSIG